MSDSVVQKKIARLVREELTLIFVKELAHYTPGKILTITVVTMNVDLSIAKVYMSLFPENDADKIIEKLNANSWEIRRLLSARIRNKLRNMPEIRFFLDDTYQEAERMDKLIDSLNISQEKDE